MKPLRLCLSQKHLQPDTHVTYSTGQDRQQVLEANELKGPLKRVLLVLQGKTDSK